MSAILSSDDLNDFISPGVACIKPLEAVPKPAQDEAANPYEVTTEDKVAQADATAAPANISLTDCLACSGCVTSAEAVLVSLQSHAEVLATLDTHPSLDISARINAVAAQVNGVDIVSNHDTKSNGIGGGGDDGMLFVASVSPQVRASLAATFDISSDAAGDMIEQFLAGPQGIGAGGTNGSKFSWVVDTNAMRQANLVLAAEEVLSTRHPEASNAQGAQSVDYPSLKTPILASSCPGWICYAEKTHPQILPHLSRLKSPQALTGTLLKSILSRKLGIHPSRIWHLSIMPCFDKKLEASRAELTNTSWSNDFDTSSPAPVRDVDCVITAKELLKLAESRGIDLMSLPRGRVPVLRPFPDPTLASFLACRPAQQVSRNSSISTRDAGTSGGFLSHVLSTVAARYPPSSTSIHIQRGRNADQIEYSVVRNSDSQVLMRAARFYGFKNITNLVRRLKPKQLPRVPGAAPRRQLASASRSNAPEYAYVEVMACPGGCTNGGGQIRAQEVDELKLGASNGKYAESGSEQKASVGPEEQRRWLAKVDEAYYSASDSSSGEEEVVGGGPIQPGIDAMDLGMETIPPTDIINGISSDQVWTMLQHWKALVGVPLEQLVMTSFREVESDVGKPKKEGHMEKVNRLAGKAGGDW